MSRVEVFVSRRIPEQGLRILQEEGVSFEVGQDDEERGSTGTRCSRVSAGAGCSCRS